ncbi:MAG: hypothetical protein JSR77_14830 [Planctomycetes bacterium]|nr:hypothetical protein [Planctomycetota bacterium]
MNCTTPRIAPILALAGLWLTGCAHKAATTAPASPPAAPPAAPQAAAPAPSSPTPAPPPPAPSAPAASPPVAAPAAPPAAPALKEVFPGVRVDAATKTIEFDGTVPIDCHNERTPVVYLELVACTPDTKEHEALVVTRTKPSNIHAAMLLIGLELGKPGVWTWEDKKITATAPTGGRVRITFIVNGKESSPADWILNQRDHRTLAQHSPKEGFVFSGSNTVNRRGQDWYQADAEGSLIGLTCFSNETISWTQMYNPDSGVEEPQWIANADTVPPMGTPVTVRISPAR